MKSDHQLLIWYHKHKRDLPWRRTKDPYLIWLSEIILQQTRVNQGLPYYIAFSERFPKVHDLASADLDEVLKLWQGLGYYSRARNLHSTAKHVVDSLNGKFPDTYQQLIELKGVGPYTAAAISSFSSGELQAVVDGNVIRVISRLYGILEPVDQSATLKHIRKLAQDLLDPAHPDLHNQAMMELGSLICSPQNPNCKECPFASRCKAFADQATDQIPLKTKKTKVKALALSYYIGITPDGNILTKQRDDSGIWKGLFDFPCIENPTSQEPNANSLGLFPSETCSYTKTYGPMEHLLSHRKITAHFHLMLCTTAFKTPNDHRWVPQTEFKTLAIPRLIDRFWELHKIEIMEINSRQ